MSTLVTRAGKGSPLTHNEVDANFTNLNTDKIQSGNTVAALTITSATVTDLAVTGITSFDGAQGTAGQVLTSAGTGATPTWTTVNALPSQSGNSGKYLTTDGSAASWGAITASTATNLAGGALGSVPYQLLSGTTTFLDGNTTTTPQFITSTGVAGVATAPTLTGSTGSGSVVLATSPTLVTPALGTPASGVVTNLTGTASININGTVGATTASTGRFSTLEATGVTTVSAGSVSAPAITTTGDTNTGIFFPAADTIAFTEGGVESMRIDSSGNVGIGVIPENKFEVKTANDAILRFNNLGATQSSQIQSTNLARSAFAPLQIGGSYTVLETSGTERMRIDSSGNVGIGISSPTQKLDVSGTSRYTFNVGNAYTLQTSINAAGSAFADNYKNALSHIWQTSGTERMRLGSAGQLGIGGANYGTSGQVLTSGGSGAAPSWSTVSLPAGTVLQVVSASKTDTQSFAPSTSFSDITGLSVSITPRSSASKFLIFFSINGGVGTGDSGHLHVQLLRNGTAVGIADAASNRTRGSAMPINTSQGGQQLTSSNMYLDSPATSSAITYKMQMKANDVGSTGYVNRSNRDNDLGGYDGRGVSNITVMEVAG